MKHLVCSKMWTDINISVPKMEFRNCCKREIQPITIEEIKELGPEVFVKNYHLMEDKKYFIEKNQLPEKCKYCKDVWPNSIWKNWNEWQSKDWSKDELENLLNEDRTTYIELMLSTTCNQTCMYCTWEVSSLWAEVHNKQVSKNQEWKEAVLYALYQYIEKYQVNRTSRLVYNFLGGEPFLDLELLDVIKKILLIHKEPKRPIIINITSNLNVKSKVIENYLEIIKNNKDFTWSLSASIDAIGTVGEELRDGLKIERFKENLELLISSKLISHIDILPSVSSISIPEYPELIRWIKNIMYKHGILNQYGSLWSLGVNVVTWPEGLHPGTLPNSYKTYIDECEKEIMDLNNHYMKKQLMIHFQNLRNMIGTRRSDIDKHRINTYFQEHSRLKNKDYFKIFPIVNELIK